MSELSYINEAGDTVFTSQYYKNRGTCCKSNCLHCPFGTTLKNLGLTFEKVTMERLVEAQKIVNLKSEGESSLASSLLGQAFGQKSVAKTEVTKDNLESFRLILIKDVICGVVKIDGKKVKELFLAPYFDNQGLNKETVESFYSN